MQSAAETKYGINSQELYTTKDAAKCVKASIPGLARMRGRGEGPEYIKTRKAVLYPGTGLINYLDDRLVKPAAHTNSAA